MRLGIRTESGCLWVASGHVPAKFNWLDAMLWSGNRSSAALQHLRDRAVDRRLTLLTGTKNPDTSEAAVLADILRR